MTSSTVYYVGTTREVGHHAAPLMRERSIQVATCEDVLRRTKPGDVAIFFSEHFQRFRDCIARLKQRQVGTIYAIDGILEWRNAWDNLASEPACPWTMRPALCDKVACIGPSQHRILSAWGNRDRLELIGIPRFDRLVDQRPSLAESLERLAAPGPKRVLVLTAKCPAFTPAQMETTVQSLRDVRDFFAAQASLGNTWNVTWRLTADLDEQLGVNNQAQDLAGAELIEQLRQTDIVISGPSTAMVEGMLLGKPVVLLDYHNVPQWVPAAWTVSRPEHLTAVMEELTDDSLETRQRVARRFEWQERVLEDTLWCRGDAAGRMSELIGHVQESVRQCIAANRPLILAADLIDVGAREGAIVESPMICDHRRLYPEYPEFAHNDLLMLQSELAQSRRDREQLQAQIEQLRSELAEAHGVFEQIHRHPVAGPIVRGRQRMIDWWHRRRVRKQGIVDTAEISS